MDNQTIVATLQSNEEQGYQLLIQQYVRYVMAILTGITKNMLPTEDIEEMAADVFFTIWKKRDHLQSDTLQYYIAQITRNAAIDQLRKKNLDVVPYDEDILSLQSKYTTDELAELREQNQIVEQAVLSFEQPERDIFIRYYYFGETLSQIAHFLRLKESTTKTKLYRTRKRLQNILKERGYGCE